MRGGYRPGSGPAKGTKYRPRAGKEGQKPAIKPDRKPKAPPNPPPEPTDAEKIRQMLAMGTKVRARTLEGFYRRVGNGEKLTLAEINKMEKIGAELAAEVGEKVPLTVDGKVETPLEFMLRIMNDPLAGDDVRLRAASLAAPFVHTRVGEGAGKKEEKSERASKAGEGRFKAGRAPLALVK
jgi:hypothetical protein